MFDDEVLADKEIGEAIEKGKSVHREYDIFNTDRAAFGRVGGAVARLHGDFNFPGTLSFDVKVRPGLNSPPSLSACSCSSAGCSR